MYKMSKKWSLSIGCLKLLEKIFWMKFSGETLSFFFTLINVFLFLDPIKKSSFINFGWPGFHFWFNENSTFWFSPNCSIVCKGNPQHLHSQIPPMTLEFLFKIHFASSLHHHCIIIASSSTLSVHNSFSVKLTSFLFVFLKPKNFYLNLLSSQCQTSFNFILWVFLNVWKVLDSSPVCFWCHFLSSIFFSAPVFFFFENLIIQSIYSPIRANPLVPKVLPPFQNHNGFQLVL